MIFCKRKNMDNLIFKTKFIKQKNERNREQLDFNLTFLQEGCIISSIKRDITSSRIEDESHASPRCVSKTLLIKAEMKKIIYHDVREKWAFSTTK